MDRRVVQRDGETGRAAKMVVFTVTIVEGVDRKSLQLRVTTTPQAILAYFSRSVRPSSRCRSFSPHISPRCLSLKQGIVGCLYVQYTTLLRAFKVTLNGPMASPKRLFAARVYERIRCNVPVLLEVQQEDQQVRVCKFYTKDRTKPSPQNGPSIVT